MTYCVAVKVSSGLVFCSDSRTNAGADQISTYSKMFTFGIEGERALVVLTAGNLATTQAVVSRLKRDMQDDKKPNLNSVTVMEDAAEYLGRLSLAQQRKHVNAAAGRTVDTSATLIFGGQIGDAPPMLYMVYPEGNYIGVTDTTLFFQIGEVKYGKPILDRIIRPDTSLDEAALCTLVSMDSTMRSNATVGPPVELLVYERNSLRLDRHATLEENDPYLMEVHAAWDKEIKVAFSKLTTYKWGQFGDRLEPRALN
jgi:putative proteasome-type protease